MKSITALLIGMTLVFFAALAVEAAPEYIFYEDFEGFEEGQHPPVDLFSFVSSGVSDSVSDIFIRKTPSGKKYLEMKTRKQDGQSNSWAAINFDEAIYYDFVLEVGVRGTGGSAAARNIRFYSKTTKFNIIGNFSAGNSIRSDTTFDIVIKQSYSTSITDEHGFLRMKFIFQRQEDGKYAVKGTCLDDPVVQYEAVLDLTDCQRLMLAQQYHDKSETLTTDLSYVKIYKYIVPEVVSTNVDSLEDSSENIDINFSVPLDAESITEDCVTLVKKGEQQRTVLTQTQGYVEGSQKISVRLYEYLDYGSDYELLFSGIKSADGVPMKEGFKLGFQYRKYPLAVTGISFKNQENSTIERLQGAASVTALANVRNDSAADKQVYAFALMFNKYGVLKNSVLRETAAPANNNATVELPLLNINTQSGDYLKVFLWEKDNDKFRILLSSPALLEY